MKKLVVFASGSGSNFEALAEACQKGELEATIELLIVDKEEAYAIERAKKYGIRSIVLLPKTFESKEAYEQAILAELEMIEPNFLILAGYMRLIGDTLLSAYPNQIVNIHPSLLPSFPGKDAIGQAVAHGVKVTGVTVHYVDAGMDTGPIIMQRAVNVVDGDVEATATAIHQVEHELYKEAIQQIMK
ncbi:phosphoribosylglycinamide formyltransferase [Savagea sp. SN6]|uniref:Phosphoribosylglycinamide formyltransferase n=1 Tax=Savagea serpentis TaxID=2785297 RepID=A0A8J7G669_9BACL|nr:phosphoribosylglycinamide formyltransferase [Savagea serpentis]MBF4502152.1 phosphoribosylglycinamide formyltransferase [Savagea serpentis]